MKHKVKPYYARRPFKMKRGSPSRFMPRGLQKGGASSMMPIMTRTKETRSLTKAILSSMGFRVGPR